MKQPVLALILTVALALRLANAFFMPLQGDNMIVSDMKAYDRAAMALLEQQPLAVHTVERYLFHPMGSDTYHPPAYYYFLAGIYAVAGHSYLAVRIVQALLDTLTCFLVFCIARDVFGHAAFSGETAGLVAAGLAALCLPLIFYTGVLLTETLSTCLLAGAIWLMLRAGQLGASRQLALRRPARHALGTGDRLLMLLALAGLVLGLAALTRSALLVVAPFLLLWVFFLAGPWPGWKPAIQGAAAFLLPAALVIAPITVRNYQIHHRLIVISTNGGVNFFLGHGGTERLKNQVRNIPPVYSEGQLVGISDRTGPEEEDYFYALGWQYIRQHPLRTLSSLPSKLADMYWASDYWPASDAQASVLRAVDNLFWKLLLLPPTLLGLFLWCGRTQRQTALLYLIVLSSASIPVLFWAQTRFRIPFVPCFIVLAAGALCEIHGRLTQRGRSTVGGVAA